uniref:Carrier domain-containing protein n=1 Tax=Hyaloperonospora arabidopsidis (strain Emoy2) TaxID=559515 RepID=M4B8U4_HYAAE
MVPHAALMTTLWWTVRTYAVTASDVFLQSTSTCLDGSLSQLFSPLLVGGSARITRPKGLHELHYMRNVLLDAPRVTFCVFVPSYFALLVNYLIDQGDSFPSSVKHVVLAGEAFPIELAHRFYRMHEKSTTCLVNEYGPTEASITSTAFQLPRSLALQGSSSVLHGLQSVPIGKPIDDHPVIVLDLQKRLVPVNVPGELYVGGAGLARGYQHRPDLTENAFILRQDLGEVLPLEKECGRRWYKTGDLVKWLPSGDLVFLGRADAQVKHHGMRIEPQEVRNVLLRHEGVKAVEVLAISQTRPPGSKQQQTSSILVAFVMAVENISDSINEKRFSDKLRSYLHEHLPMHMVPKLIQVVRCWPRIPSGKVDLRTLANWANVHSSSTEATTQDADGGNGSTITVQLAIDILRQVWMQALGINSIHDTEGIDTDQHEKCLISTSFFELGGDSLAAIRAIALARARGLPLALEQFFRSSSLPEMARNAATSMTNLRELTSQTLVPLNWPSTKACSSLPTLFLFHDAVGTVWQLLELARQLPFAVVGIQASTSFSEDDTDSILETQPSSVEELAELYWNQIRERQSEGPYTLGGFSFGCRLAYEVARLVMKDGHKILPLILLDGLPFVMPFVQTEANKVQDLTTQLRIDEYANEAFSDPFLRPLRVNFRKFCSMDQNYQPYTFAEVELASSKPTPPIWLHADLYMTQHSTADVAQYRQLGISITIVSAIPNCTHLTMLRYPSVKVVARQIQQRAKSAPHVEC